MRTDEEILERIQAVEGRDFLGFEMMDLIIRLPFETAKPLLKEGAIGDDWTAAERDREAILKEMKDYMSFAWDKANNMRGISASRTMSHYNSWTWLAGDDFGDLTEFEFYGKDNLVKLCDHYGWDATVWDDGERTNG